MGKARNPYVATHPDLFPPEGRYPDKLDPHVPFSRSLDASLHNRELARRRGVLPGGLAGAILTEAKKHEAPETARRATRTALRKQEEKAAPGRTRAAFGIPEGRRMRDLAPGEAERLAAAARGETPVFVPLEELTSAQIRELKRGQFTDAEWDQLDEDDREYISDNDEDSQARVDALADLFIDRYKSAIENAGNEDVDDYFHEWLSNERNLYDIMPQRRYTHLVNFGDQHGIDEDRVREIINEYLEDPGRYDVSTNRQGSVVWDYEAQGDIYIDGSEIRDALKGMSDDEKKRAVDKINDETDSNASPSVRDLDRIAENRHRDYEGDRFDTGTTIYATIDWSDVEDSIENEIAEQYPLEDEDDEVEEVDLDTLEVPKQKKLPRPAQPVVFEWPDGTTIVDMQPDDEEVGILEALGILDIPWTVENKNKPSLKGRIDRGEIRISGRDSDGMPTFRRGELAFGLESLELAHCVGWHNQPYMDKVRAGKMKILSMRRPDPTKRVVYTIEATPIENGAIAGIGQIKGFSNAVPGFDRGEQGDVDTKYKIEHLTEGQTEKVIAKFRSPIKAGQGSRSDDAQKIIEWVISLGFDPTNIVRDGDLDGAINLIKLMSDRGDPWAMALQTKIDAARGAIPGEVAPAPRENPTTQTCEHGCGFCTPARRNPSESRRSPPGRRPWHTDACGKAKSRAIEDWYAFQKAGQTTPISATDIDILRVMGDALDEGADDKALAVTRELRIPGLSADLNFDLDVAEVDQSNNTGGPGINRALKDQEDDLLAHHTDYILAYWTEILLLAVPELWGERGEAARDNADRVRRALDASSAEIAGALRRHPRAVTSSMSPQGKSSKWTEPRWNVVLVFTEYGIGDPHQYPDVFEAFDRATFTLSEATGHYWVWESINPGVTVFTMRVIPGIDDQPLERNPASREDAIKQFVDLVRDPDPNAMQIAEDLALDNNLSLVELGEYPVKGQTNSPDSGFFAMSPYSPQELAKPWIGVSDPSAKWWPLGTRQLPAGSRQLPQVTSGWSLTDTTQPTTWATQGSRGPSTSYLLEIRWQDSGITYPKQGYMPSFRTPDEARRAAAADAWAVAKAIKGLPASTPKADVYRLIEATVKGVDRTAPALTRPSHVGKAAPKRQTYVQAQDAAIDALRRAGWTPSAMLKVRHITSPSGRVRLWFKPQSVYVSRVDPGSVDHQRGENTHTLGNAMSLSTLLPDLRDLTGSDFVEEIRRRFPKEFATG